MSTDRFPNHTRQQHVHPREYDGPLKQLQLTLGGANEGAFSVIRDRPVDLVDRSESGREIFEQSSIAFQLLYTAIVAELAPQITVPKDRRDDVTQHAARPLQCRPTHVCLAIRPVSITTDDEV